MKTSGVAYEVDYKYTVVAGKKLKQRMKDHKDDGEKSRKDKKITG